MLELSALELRVIGCLLEKEITTPDQYPLSLNALMTACNQKSNRDPVLSLNEQEVQDVVDELDKKGLIMIDSLGGRVAKYKHRFCNTEFSQLKFTDQEKGMLTVLFLRGPQTPGELRTRTQRLCKFNDVMEVEHCLNSLKQRDSGALIMRLEREPGKREVRYCHLFSDTPPQISDNSGSHNTQNQAPQIATTPSALSRIEQLESDVEQLKEQVNQLISLLD